MRPRPRALHLVTAALVTVASAGLLPATPEGTALPSPQAPAGTPAVAQTAGVTASRVAVDLVVRDKKGRLVRDLRASDLEVLEDGAPQEILSVRLVDTIGGARAVPGEGSTAPAATTAAPPPEDHPLYLAFLFDRLSPQARRTAHDAAIEWLQRQAPPTRQVGVFRIDQGLQTLHVLHRRSRGRARGRRPRPPVDAHAVPLRHATGSASARCASRCSP